MTGNSGFCVALGMMALHQQGVHGQFLIKKRRYWPKHILGDYIDQYMMAMGVLLTMGSQALEKINLFFLPPYLLSTIERYIELQASCLRKIYMLSFSISYLE
jgi:hypothetical protein